MFSLRAFQPFVAIVLSVASARDPEVAKQAFLERGDEDFAAKKYEVAMISYLNAVQQNPLSGEARHRLAKAYALSNDSQNALKQFVRAADLLPGDTTVQLEAVKALLLASRFDDARARVETLLKIDPKNTSAHIMHAAAIAGLRDFDTAITAIEEVIKLQPDRGNAYIDLARLRLAKGQKKDAEIALEQALALSPRSIEAHVGDGEFLSRD